MPVPLGLTVSPGSVALSRAKGAITPKRVTFTLTNAGDRPVIVRARLEPLGEASSEWLELEGESELEVVAGATHTFNVLIAPPPDAPVGRHTFRLNAVDVHRPDEGEVEGPKVAVEVPEPAGDAPSASPRWRMLAGAAVVLVAVVAVAIWWIWPLYPPPQLSPLADTDAPVGGPPTEVPFLLSGAPPRRVELTASSSDPTLIPDSAIDIRGGDGDRERTLRLTPVPGEGGRAEITLIAEDASGRVDRVSFDLDVGSPVDPSPEPRPVAFERLARDRSGAGPSAHEFARIEGDCELDGFWREVQGNTGLGQAPSPPPEVDFDRETLLGVRLAETGSVQSGLAVERVVREDDEMTVELRLTEPAEDDITSPVVTAPWLLISVDDTDAARITVHDADDGTMLGRAERPACEATPAG